MSDYALECPDCGVSAIEHVSWYDSDGNRVDYPEEFGALYTREVVAECPECHAFWTVDSE